MPHDVLRLPLGSLLLMFLAVAPCRADDANDATLPESQKELAVTFCTDADASPKACKNSSLTGLAREVDAAAKAALAKANPVTAVLLKRDQVWFGEVVELNAQNLDLDKSTAPAAWDKIAAALKRRQTALGEIATGFGRSTIAGKWVNAFGTVEIAPAAEGALQVEIATEASYGQEDVQQQSCKASILVRPGTDGWLVGETDASAPTTQDRKERARLRLRLQGETLRIVAGDEIKIQASAEKFGCSNINQVTGSYFPAGKTETVHRAAAPFTAPTFDCARPATASEEEICADPELAANDQRINRAWQALLPRLDATTRRLLTQDQRGWVHDQGLRYPGQLHPPRAKMSWFVHWTGLARDNLADIQRERIELLEGFDGKRRRFEGDWKAHNAQISVTRDPDGGIHVDGNKWFEDDYKGGCDYDFKGRIVDDLFKPDDKSKNPDSIARDHATLIVNRTDDEDAKHRFGPDGRATVEEGKCRRSLSISSTARLFPVKPSTDSGR